MYTKTFYLIQPVGEDEDDADLGLDSEVVTSANFGGGSDAGEKGYKTSKCVIFSIPLTFHREVYEELIARSKKARVERMKEKENRAAFTKELDEQFAVLRGESEMLKLRKKQEEEEEEAKMNAGPLPMIQTHVVDTDYDVIVRQLTFEATAPASDRIKSQEELAKLHKEQLEELEAERKRRMRPDGNYSDDNEEQLPGSDDEDGVTREKHQRSRKRLLSEVDEKSLQIPFTFSRVPDSLKEYEELVLGWESEQHELIIRRIFINYHPALQKENPQMLTKFFTILLDRFQCSKSMEELDSLYRGLTFLIKELDGFTSPSNINKEDSKPFGPPVVVRELLSRLHRDTVACFKWPSANQILLLKLFAEAFPCTDFRHVVVLPVFLVISQCLSLCPIRTNLDLLMGLLSCTVAINFMKLSGKFFAEVIDFLACTLLLLVDRDKVASDKSLRHYFDLPTLLDAHVTLDEEDNNPQPFTIPLHTDVAVISKASLLHASIGILNTLVITLHTLWTKTQEEQGPKAALAGVKSLQDAFSTHQTILSLIKEEDWVTKPLLDSINSFSVTIVSNDKPPKETNMPTFTTVPRRHPTAIKECNPSLKDFTSGKDTDPDQGRVAVKKLKKKLQREMKGAVRELKKDNAFVEAKRQKEKVQERAEIQAKGKQIMHMLEVQQHEANIESKDKKKARMKSKKGRSGF